MASEPIEIEPMVWDAVEMGRWATTVPIGRWATTVPMVHGARLNFLACRLVAAEKAGGLVKR